MALNIVLENYFEDVLVFVDQSSNICDEIQDCWFLLFNILWAIQIKQTFIAYDFGALQFRRLMVSFWLTFSWSFKLCVQSWRILDSHLYHLLLMMSLDCPLTICHKNGEYIWIEILELQIVSRCFTLYFFFFLAHDVFILMSLFFYVLYMIGGDIIVLFLFLVSCCATLIIDLYL